MTRVNSELSRSYIIQLIDAGAITVNGKAAKSSYIVRLNDVIELMLPPVQTTGLVPSDISIDIPYQDADLVIGAVLIPGASAPKLVTHKMLQSMKKGSVLVDVAEVAV
jgi:alanine dehydrogenase